MRRSIALIAAASALLSFTAPTLAVPVPAPAPPGQFELGVDIGGVAPTATAVHAFLSALSPDSRDSVVHQCQSFLANPGNAKAMDTLIFCSFAASPPA